MGGQGLGAVGPEGGRQPGAFDWQRASRLPALAEGQQSEEGVPLAGAQARERQAVEARLERPEEMEGQRRVCRGRMGQSCGVPGDMGAISVTGLEEDSPSCDAFPRRLCISV